MVIDFGVTIREILRLKIPKNADLITTTTTNPVLRVDIMLKVGQNSIIHTIF